MHHRHDNAKKSGEEVCKEIRKLVPGIKVIFMSGCTAEKIKYNGMPAGREFIQKPVSLQALLRQMRDMLDKR